MEDEAKLLPCPFCGGRARKNIQLGSDGQWFGCGECCVDARTPEAWNTRAPAPLAWSGERPDRVGKWAVRWKDRTGNMPLDWWVIEVHDGYLRRKAELRRNGFDASQDHEFAGPIPEPMEAEA